MGEKKRRKLAELAKEALAFAASPSAGVDAPLHGTRSANANRTSEKRNGLPVLGKDERGLVVNSPYVTVLGPASIRVAGQGLDPEALRFALLYWDKLVFPAVPVVGPGHGQDEDFLIRADVMTRPLFGASGEATSLFLAAQSETFKYLNNISPGSWAFGDGDLSHQYASPQLVSGGGFSVALQRAIPIPKKDVHLADILEFKTRRKDELTALRGEIDKIASQIEIAENTADEFSRAVTRVEQACADVLQVASEWKLPFQLGSIEPNYEFRPNQAIKAAYDAFIGTKAATNSIPLSLVAGVAWAGTSLLKFNLKGFGWKGGLQTKNPFRYVARMHGEL